MSLRCRLSRVDAHGRELGFAHACCRVSVRMRPLPTLAAVVLLPATRRAGQPLTLAPAADGGFDIRDGQTLWSRTSR